MTAIRDQSEVIFPVVQAAHGFSPGQALRRDTGSWVKALADTSANGSMVGVVDRVINANTFYLRLTGKITGLSGLTSGTTYYLSTTTPGALTPTAPSTVGQLYRPVLVADSATSGYVYNDAGMVVGTGPPGPPGPGGDITTSPIWDAKGDLAVGTGPDTSIRLACGPQGYFLVSDTVQTAGLGWGRPLGVLNVKTERGAVGNGSTNDTTAFQNGIADIIASGGIFLIPSGNYVITSTLDFAALNGNHKTVKVLGSGNHHFIGYPGSNCVIQNQTGSSLFKAVGYNNGSYVIYPELSFEGFKVHVPTNQGAGVPTFDIQWPSDGFSIKDVTIVFWDAGSGVDATGDGIRLTLMQYSWTLENVVVWGYTHVGMSGSGIIISDGHRADGSIINANLGHIQSGNGTLTSCVMAYTKHYPAFDFVGNVMGITCNSIKVATSNDVNSIGVRCIGPDTIRFNAAHIEGPKTSLRVETLIGAGTVSNISFQGMISGADTSTVGIDQPSGTYCEYDVSFRGTFNNYAKFGTSAFYNVVRHKPNPDGATAVTPFVDSSSNKLNRIEQGSMIQSAAGDSGVLALLNPVSIGGAVAAYGRSGLAQKLELNTSANFGGVALNTWNTGDSGPILDFNVSRSPAIGTQAQVSSGNFLGQVTFRGSDGASFQDAARVAGFVDGATGAGNMPGRLQFGTTPAGSNSVAERMRIDNQGTVLINGTAVYGRYSQKLEINQSANYGGVALTTWSATAAQAPSLDFNRSKSATIGTMTPAVASGDLIGQITFRGSDGTNFIDATAISSIVEGTPGTNVMSGRLAFYTNPGGASTVERLRIDRNGNVFLAAAAFATLATTATDGFPHIPKMAGTPSGAPSAFYGVPIVYDTTAKRLWIYDYSIPGWRGTAALTT
jgi:hypothetical protein